ncbi:hypothetical protein BGZ80_005792 [Entomortierella chlamydospora]|uniref:Uncharacterized protein n=1 Tax=Entomortierella chlamydospora TaxID=101097 RepID=A0A9P6MZV1_9FUNG|nr:hypothetical protein BGZ79_007804 [Entomortierella chlamydospora]KAG0019452.1 hypothetical protein BGZ80_005792 [Entomortierella chlamydospora]
MAKSDPSVVVSGAIFVGEDTTNNDASPLDVFKNPENYATTVASGYLTFETKATTFPGFVKTSLSETEIHLDGSFTHLERQIRENYDSPDAAVIARNLRDLIPGVVEEKSLSGLVLSLLVIRKPFDSDKVTVRIVQTLLDISSDEYGTTYIPDQTATLKSVEIEAIPNVFNSNAERLAQSIPVVKMPELINYFTSPKASDETLDGLERNSHSCDQQTRIAAPRRGLYPLSHWLMRD